MDDVDFKIRLAEEKDREVLYRFHCALYLEYRKQIIPDEFEALYAYKEFEQVLREDVNAILRDSSSRIWVAESGGRTIGYLTGRIENQQRRLLPKRGIVEDWFVEKEYRNLGVGKKLFDAAMAFFKSQRCQVVDSGTWALNENARKVHCELGFHEVEVKFRMKL